MKMSKTKLKIIQTVLELIVAAVVFGMSCFAWFAENKNTTASSGNVNVLTDSGFNFYSTVTAVRHYETGALLKNTYTISDGVLKLTNAVFTADESGEEADPSKSTDDEVKAQVTEGNDMLFVNMLPGEYVDITLSVYTVNSDIVGRKYQLSLSGFGCETVNVFNFVHSDEENNETTTDTVRYGVLPAFKWGVVSTDSSGSDATSLTYFHSEFLTENTDASNIFEYYCYTDSDGNSVTHDDSAYSQTIYTGTWTDSNLDSDGDGTADNGSDSQTAGTITFRIQADFDEYHNFLNTKVNEMNSDGWSWDYANYLSEKKLSIGSIKLIESFDGGDQS